MPYKDKKRQNTSSSTHYNKYKSYYVDKAKEWNEKYRIRNRNFITRVKLRFGCQYCGYKRCALALEFHHQDPNQKDLSVTALVNKSCSLERIRKEIRKCILLCSNCHREEHDRLGISVD